MSRCQNDCTGAKIITYAGRKQALKNDLFSHQLYFLAYTSDAASHIKTTIKRSAYTFSFKCACISHGTC